jgi:putative glycosyltransferase (TIGR04372 family)
VTNAAPQIDQAALTANAIVEAAKKHLEERRAKEAVTLLETAAQIWPKNGRVRHQLGLALLALGNADGIGHLREAVLQEPTNVDRLADMAEACESVGDSRGAEAWFRRAIARSPARADLSLRCGVMLSRAMRHDEAIAWLRRATALKHPYAYGHTALGAALQRAGRLGEAIACFHRAIAVDPGYMEGYVGLAATLSDAGGSQEEIARPLRIVADRHPDWTEVVNPVVQYLRDFGEEDAYIRYATRWINLETEKVARDEIGAFGFRVIRVDSILSRYGEIAFMIDLHVKMKMLGWLPPFVSILLAPREAVCNWPLLEYWRPYITIVDDPELIRRLDPLKTRVPFNLVYVPLPDGKVVSKARAYHVVHGEWQRQGRKPLLKLTPEHEEHGRAELARMGVPDGAWFVALHVREPGHLREGPNDSETFRNADVFTYRQAVEEIVRRGGWVIRVGDATMKPLPPMPGVVDYAVSPFRSEVMDVILMASCRFMLGTTSGPVAVSEAFGVPVGAADYYPIGGLLHTSNDVIVPRLYREKATGRLLKFEEYLKMPFAFTYDSNRVAAFGLDVIPSAPEDICDLAIEMLERTEGKWPYDAEDEKLNARWHEICRPFTMGVPVGCRVGRGFLRRHRHLFQSV